MLATRIIMNILMGFVDTHYRLHLRSLFISKFVYTNLKSVSNLRGSRIALRGASSSYPIMGLFFLLLTGYLPHAKFSGARGPLKARARPLLITGFLNRTATLQLVARFHVLYWTALEQASQFKSLFKGALHGRSFLVSFRSIFYVFFELDAMAGFSYAALRSFTNSWEFDILFALRGSNYESVSLLRALGVPLLT